MGPRFTPITEPMDLKDDFLKVAAMDEFGKTTVPSVVTVHIPSTATISKTTSTFYGRMGYATRVLGLIPCIQTAQHLGLKKVCVGITDYVTDHGLRNVDSFAQLMQMFEVMFGQLET